MQGILGHSQIQTPLDLYTDKDLDKMVAAIEKYIVLWHSKPEGFHESCGWNCG